MSRRAAEVNHNFNQQPKTSTINIIMSASIRTIGVIGTGVIGSSWTALFLAHGLNVIVSDPAPGAKDRLDSYLRKEWPAVEKAGLAPGASVENYQFVENMDDYLDKVDFVQEVRPFPTEHYSVF